MCAYKSKHFEFIVDISKHLFIINASTDIFHKYYVISFSFHLDIKMCRGVAQLVAYSLWERGVVSSSLAAPTTKNLKSIIFG